MVDNFIISAITIFIIIILIIIVINVIMKRREKSVIKKVLLNHNIKDSYTYKYPHIYISDDSVIIYRRFSSHPIIYKYSDFIKVNVVEYYGTEKEKIGQKSRKTSSYFGKPMGYDGFVSGTIYNSKNNFHSVVGTNVDSGEYFVGTVYKKRKNAYREYDACYNLIVELVFKYTKINYVFINGKESVNSNFYKNSINEVNKLRKVFEDIKRENEQVE